MEGCWLLQVATCLVFFLSRGAIAQPAVFVSTAPGFISALTNGTKHIVVQADLDLTSLDAVDMNGTLALLHIRGQARSITGSCQLLSGRDACSIRVRTPFSVLALTGKASAWLHRLTFHIINDSGAPLISASGLISAQSPGSRLWMTEVSIRALDPCAMIPQVGIVVGGGARVFAQGCRFSQLRSWFGPLARVENGGKLTMFNTVVNDSIISMSELVQSDSMDMADAFFFKSFLGQCIQHRTSSGRARVWEKACPAGSDNQAHTGHPHCAWCRGDPPDVKPGQRFLTMDDPNFRGIVQAANNSTAGEVSAPLDMAEATSLCYDVSTCVVRPTVCHADSEEPPAWLAPPTARGRRSENLAIGIVAFFLSLTIMCTLCAWTAGRRTRIARDRHAALEAANRSIAMTYLGELQPGDVTVAMPSIGHRVVWEHLGACACKAISTDSDGRAPRCPECGSRYAVSPPGKAASQPDHRPVALPCGHSVCAACATTRGLAEQGGESPWTWAGVQAPLNITAIQLLECLPSMPSRSAPLLFTLAWAHRTASWALGSIDVGRRGSSTTPGAPAWAPHVEGGLAPERGLAIGQQAPFVDKDEGCEREAGASGCARRSESARGSHSVCSADSSGRGAFAGGPALDGGAHLPAVPAAGLLTAKDAAAPTISRRLDPSATPFASALRGAVWGARGNGAAAAWVEEELTLCPVCLERYLPMAPREGQSDRRPVVFPCGHGACAACATNAKLSGCGMRCEWPAEFQFLPVPINHLVCELLRAAGQNESAALD